jgi:hypothetical protein
VIRTQKRLATLRKQHRERHDRFEFSLRKALETLLELLLPDLEESTIQEFSDRSGIVLDAKLGQEMLEDRDRCQRELKEIESDPIYLTRDQSLCPTTGELNSDLAELQLHHRALQPVLKTCFKDPRFPELLESGYGTKKYKKRFWRLAYHLDRKAAKEIEEACGGRPFAEIRQDVLTALEASSILENRIKTLQQRRKDIEEVCSRRSKLKKRLQRHEEIWLNSSRWQIRRELERDPEHYFEKLQSQGRWSDELCRWRLLSELCQEHKRLKLEYLAMAAQALKDEDKSEACRLMDEYEQMESSLARFDSPATPEKRVDWKAFFYRS